jgi:hypothetical protein
MTSVPKLKECDAEITRLRADVATLHGVADEREAIIALRNAAIAERDAVIVETRAQLARIHGAAAVTSALWRPIETAPKDGRRVDLWVLDTAGNGYRYPDAAYGFVRGRMGWTDANNHGALEPYVRPTHWMPPPDPPEVARQLDHAAIVAARPASGDQE